VPGRPRGDVCRLCAVEVFEQTNERVLAGFHRPAPSAASQNVHPAFSLRRMSAHPSR
jgi:hypothetical protein